MPYETEVSIREYNEIQNQTFGTKEIKYSRPKFIHRVLANLVDFIIFALLFVGLFLLSRYIISNTPDYKYSFNKLTQMRLDSGLYVEGDNKNEIVDLVSYLNSHTQYTPGSIVYNCEKGVTKFFAFEQGLLAEDKYNRIVDEYDKLRLDATTVVEDVETHLWYRNSENQIVKNDNYESSAFLKSEMSKWYCNYIDRYLQGYLSTTPQYYDLTKKISNYLLFVEIPVSFVLSLILVYFVPTLFFRHGRQTLGKGLYHIGTVDSRYLSPTFWRNLSKFGIFVVEMIAGIATLGILYIISFTMMAFTKNRQSFPEYMLGLQEVDTSRNKIYMSMVEALLDNAQTNKKPNDFKLIDEP
jgi:hypothetical protein